MSEFIATKILKCKKCSSTNLDIVPCNGGNDWVSIDYTICNDCGNKGGINIGYVSSKIIISIFGENAGTLKRFCFKNGF